MAKVVGTAAGTSYDPLAASQQELQNLGLAPTKHNTEFSLTSETTGLNEFNNIDLGQYDKPPSLYSNDAQASSILNEMRAQNQGAGEQFLKGVGRVASTAITELFKVPGYLGGALGSSLMEGDFIENTVDNAWVNAFQSLDENIKESIPIYLTKEVEEGGIGRKLMSSAWWSTTGADGIGFLLSMYAPGKVIGALGSGLKLARGVEAIANSSKLGSKLARLSGLVDNAATFTEQGLKVTGKGVGKLESLATVATNTFVESAAEAANTFDNVKEAYMRNNPNATEEEAKKVAGDQAAAVMKANIAVLAISNYFDELTLFNGFGKGDAAIKNSIFGKLTKDGIIDFTDLSKIEKYGFRQWASKELPAKVAASFAKEGFFEEGLQTKIQQHYEKKAAGETSENFFDDVIGNYFHSLLSDIEMQEAVVLGGILGGGAGVIGSYSDMKNTERFLRGGEAYTPNFFGKMLGRKPREATKGFLDLANENFIQSTRSLKDIAELEDDGRIKFQTKQKEIIDPVTGKTVIQDVQVPVINQDKLKNLMEEKSSMLQLVTLHSILSQAGEVEQAEVYKQLIDYARFTPFIQQEGGYEVLEAFIKSGKLTELEANQILENENRTITDAEKQDITNGMLKQAKLFKDVYDEVNRTFIPEKYVKPDDKEQYNAWKQTAFNRKLQNLLASKNLTQQMFNIKNKYGDFELTEDDYNTLTPDEALNKKRSKDVYDNLAKQWQDAKETYLKLSDANGLRNDYEEFKKEKEEELTKVGKELKDSTQEALDDNTATSKFKETLQYSGYNVTDSTNGFNAAGLDGNQIVLERNSDNKNVILTPINNNGVIDYVMVNDDGTSTLVTKNGIFSKSFLDSMSVVIADNAKEQIEKAKIQQLKNEKLRTLELLQEFQKQNYKEGKERLQELDKLFASTYEEISKYNDQLNDAVNGVNARKAGNSTATNQAVDRAVIEGLLNQAFERYNALNNERQFLVTTLANITKLTVEYENIANNIRENPEYDLEKELKDITKNIEEFTKDGKELLDGINLIETQTEALEKHIGFLNFTLDAFKGFSGLMKVNRKEWKKAFAEISKIIQDKTILEDLSMVKNQIDKNRNNVSIYNKYSKIITDINTLNPDLLPLFINKLKEYEISDDELINTYGLGAETLDLINNKILLSNQRVIELRQALTKLLNTNFTDLKEYIALASLVSQKLFTLYYNAEHDFISNSIDRSQQAPLISTEVNIVPDVNDIFAQGNLPETMYSTTGVSVKYDDNGNDQITAEGFPALTDFKHQRNWFYTIDKLANSITDYQLKVVKAVWDSNDEIQRVLQENNPNPQNRGDNDLFVVLVDKDGKYVRIDDDNNIGDKGSPVFTSISRPERMFPPGSKAKVQTRYLLNFYLKSKGVNRIRYDSDLADKAVNVQLSEIFNSAELKQLGLDVDNTLNDLLNASIILAEKTYKDQYETYSKKQPTLQIQGISKGYRVYQLDENGVKKQFKPLDNISEISLKSDNFTSGQLQGGRLAIATEASVKGPNNTRIKLPPGTVYLTLTNNEVIPLTQRKINDNEAKVIMYLLSQSAGKSLKEFKVDIKNSDGSDFNYTIGTNTLSSPFNVFYTKAFNAPSFSLLNTFIHYGLKPKGQSPNGQLYINSNKIYYTTFAGENKVLEISDLTKALTLDNPQEFNSDVQEFYDFLLSKNFNIDSSLLNNNGKFAYPTYTKNGLSFDTSQTYYSFLFDNVVTTTITKKEGYPNRLQRNLSFGNQSNQNKNRSKKPAASAQTNPTTKQAPTPPVISVENQPTSLEGSKPVDKKADIKKDRYYNSPANRMVRVQKESQNTNVTQEEIDEIEAVIEKAKELGWDKNRLFTQLSKMGYSYALGVNPEAFRNYLEDRLSGKTNIKVTSEYNFFEQLDAELAALENSTSQSQPVTSVVNKPLTDESTIDIHINGLFYGGFMPDNAYRFKGSSVTSAEKIQANVNRDLRSHFSFQNFNGPPAKKNAQVDEDGFIIDIIDDNFTMYTYGLRGVDAVDRDGYFSVSITIPNTIPVATVKNVMKNTIDGFAKEMILKYIPDLSRDMNIGLSALNLAKQVTKKEFNDLLETVKTNFTTVTTNESLSQQNVATKPKSKKLTPAEIKANLKSINESSAPIISKKPTKINKTIDPEVLLERYVNNNIIQKNCK